MFQASNLIVQNLRLSILFLIILYYSVFIIFFDFKYKIIKNYVIISLGICLLFIDLFFFIYYQNYINIAIMFFETLFIFALNYITFKLKIVGGGDVKLLTILTLAIPFNYFLFYILFFYVITYNINFLIFEDKNYKLIGSPIIYLSYFLGLITYVLCPSPLF